MNAPASGQAEHRPYVGAMQRRLEARDVAVDGARVTAAGGWREAALVLRPDQEAFPLEVPPEAVLSWDEENGWSLAACRDSATGPATSVHKGLSVLPDPDDVAAWVVVLLTHPELTPDREHQPFRDHRVPDPAFDAQLARYAPGA
jgi:hypothetical protein